MRQAVIANSGKCKRVIFPAKERERISLLLPKGNKVTLKEGKKRLVNEKDVIVLPTMV